MDERREQERGEFGDEGNPPGAKAPRTPAEGEFGGEGNPPGLRPEDALPDDAEEPGAPGGDAPG